MNLADNRKLKAMGAALDREGMSERVIEAVQEFQVEGSTYRGAIFLAGRLKAIAAMTAADEYWREKMNDGFRHELRKPLPDAQKQVQP